MVEDNLIFVDEFEVRITRKKVKSLRIRVAADGHIEASVPQRMARTHVEDFIRLQAHWIREQQERTRRSPLSQAELASKEEIEAWRAVIKSVVPLLVAKWGPIMGVHVGKLAYRNMRSRWGSCQPETGRVCINIRLALYPPECLEYVVVHEMCHLLVPGHGPRFWAAVESFLPSYREAVAKLAR
ncbi:M48 family metallopeptidase [Curtanaerobium respiraculi]|uniref:M48 family metallopeptidase n=1 Tax=Curtanaerobium respiraculi TaxID=2949669 RepID=UPI0024B35FEB|nr:SprT family zinc-dependent metalloprotease [Curtanaerobium respiraculi]